MIILDTCILYSCGLETSSAELLRTIRESRTESVSVPWVVMEELVAQKAVKYNSAHEAVTKAIEQLSQATPWTTDLLFLDSEPERVREHWRKKYGELVEVIPTGETALREAAFREANGLAPAKIVANGSRSVKTGYRDVAVWMSAIDYAEAHPEETVYFVSSNTKDFGDGVTHAFPMRQDLRDLGGRFVHLTSLDEVLTRFTEPAEIDLDSVQNLLTGKDVSPEVGQHVTTRDGNPGPDAPWFDTTAFRGGPGRGPFPFGADSWLASPVAAFESVSDAKAYKIDNHVWCTASVRWRLSGLALESSSGTRDSFRFASCWWDTRVLLSVGDDPRLVVLRGDRPRRLTDEDVESYDDWAVAAVGVLKNAMDERAVTRDFPIADSVSLSFPDEDANYLMERLPSYFYGGHDHND
ncbi:PIN domain-containing protein [Streptomyces xanthochromogenes]|uniref:PIN domain-containing protein n=1 Tax=Streptomyces xanthochromogenes TaxID=67384 RepID=UPI0037A6F69C